MKLARAVLLGSAVTLLLVGFAVALGPPRLHLTNASMFIDYPWWRGASALLSAGASGLLARWTPRHWLRRLGVAWALLMGLFGFSRLLFRLEVGAEALAVRALLAATAIPWREVGRVEQGEAMLVITGGGEAQIRVRTSDFGPDQRASLERAIARRLREAQAATNPR